MRVVKNPEERRGEILDTAERLFTTRGYANTTINDILAAIGIAKGTFYYYYKSKEEVMDAIVMRIIEQQVAEVEKVADDEYLSVHEKLFSILMSLRAGRDHAGGEGEGRPDNAEMQQKSLVALITHVGPVVARVIEQGKEEGIFATPYPQAMVEQLLLSLRILFDEGLFSWDEKARIDRARAFATAMESTLEAAEGSFNYVAELLSGYPAMMT